MYNLTKPEQEGWRANSQKVLWIEFNPDGTFKKQYKTPKVGRSLIMSPFNEFFTWRTTAITEIIEKTPTTLIFRTKNTLYKMVETKDL